MLGDLKFKHHGGQSHLARKERTSIDVAERLAGKGALGRRRVPTILLHGRLPLGPRQQRGLGRWLGQLTAREEGVEAVEQRAVGHRPERAMQARPILG